GDDAADGAGEEDLLGLEEVPRPEHALLGEGFELQHDLPGDAGEDAAAEGRREDPPSLDHEEVARGGLGEVALGVEEEGLVVAGVPGLEEAEDAFGVAEELVAAAGGLVVAATADDPRRELPRRRGDGRLEDG